MLVILADEQTTGFPLFGESLPKLVLTWKTHTRPKKSSAVLVNNRPIGIIEVKVARQLISCRFAIKATMGVTLLDREKFDCHPPSISLNGPVTILLTRKDCFTT